MEGGEGEPGGLDIYTDTVPNFDTTNFCYRKPKTFAVTKQNQRTKKNVENSEVIPFALSFFIFTHSQLFTYTSIFFKAIAIFPCPRIST